MKCNKQFKHSNFVTLSRFHRTTVNNSGLVIEHKSNVPKGFKLYKQSKPENLDDELFF